MSGDGPILINIGGATFEDLADIAANTDARAVLEAAEAMRRGEREERTLGPRHASVLIAAVLRRRGPFALRLEAELLAYHRITSGNASEEAQREHMAPLLRGELREMFLAEVDEIVREAEGR